MFHCHICGSKEAREELVSEVFNLKRKTCFGGGYSSKSLCTLW